MSLKHRTYLLLLVVCRVQSNQSTTRKKTSANANVNKDGSPQECEAPLGYSDMGVKICDDSGAEIVKLSLEPMTTIVRLGESKNDACK